MKVQLAVALALVAIGNAYANGSISGTVKLAGAAPALPKIKRTSDPVCSSTAQEMADPTVSVGKDGKSLDNVVVRVIGPTEKAPAGDVVVNQHECTYEPRVQGAVEGQKIQVKNEDGTLHNVHAYDGSKTLFNQAQPAKSPPIEKAVTAKDVVTLKCDVHPWMRGYVVLNKNPYFAVSKDGKFEIKDVPDGTYKVEAWQEKLGTKTVDNVKVGGGAKTEADFTF